MPIPSTSFWQESPILKKKYTNNFHYCIKILLIIIFVVVELAFWICNALSVQTNVAIPFRSFSNLLWVFILSSWDFDISAIYTFHLHPHHHIFLWALRIYIMKNLCTPHWILCLVYHYVWSMLYCIEDICHKRNILGTIFQVYQNDISLIFEYYAMNSSFRNVFTFYTL